MEKQSIFIATLALPVRGELRARYDLRGLEPSQHGNTLQWDIDALQHICNQVSHEGTPLYLADVHAFVVMHAAFALLLARSQPHLLQLYSLAQSQLGQDTCHRALTSVVAHAPPPELLATRLEPERYVQRSQATRLETLQRLWLLRLYNANPALANVKILVDDSALGEDYRQTYHTLRQLAAQYPQSIIPGESHDLDAMLRAPQQTSPRQLSGQLEYLRSRYTHVLGTHLMPALLRSFDLLAEASKGYGAAPTTPASPPVPSRADLLGQGSTHGTRAHHASIETVQPEHYARFSVDDSWMPEVVMLAKSVYVWLAQLSQQHERAIQRLDDIPDSTLDALADNGITALWLIGIWQRSPASQRIKQRMGNPEALASAYALYDYHIAQDLGGLEAFEALKQRAHARGIRLASDMVPNHMAIDSRWVIEHPDWFLSLPTPPFANYRFHSENLSQDPRVRIRLEDHYYDHSDAAVVFERQDSASGETRYIYHGNDGTLYPWNDTAQLDFSKPEVREAVIQTILHVARQVPIIRFDAAMVLAKQHIQRLWFPPPGMGGAIPSRSHHGSMTTETFNQHIPQEFWREVVDRVAKEAPNTLLIAEAFWLLEGYFVRTLGMHRVYNSAFMHMLSKEENANYRASMREVLRFEPEILGRYVNFMSNPDEKPASQLFGDGDKYFAVFMMMVTLPGLPLIAHGQCEGYREQYGMEYASPRQHEAINQGLLDRHRWESFPILRRRWQFAKASHFLLYDVHDPTGKVLDDVYAYTNAVEGQVSLCIIHNRATQVQGTLQQSVAVARGDSIRHYTLAEALGIHAPQAMVSYLDVVTHLYYLRPAAELIDTGFSITLGAYAHHAFVDVEIHADDDGSLRALCQQLAGQGVPSIPLALRNLRYASLQASFGQLLKQPEAAAQHYLSFREQLPERLESFASPFSATLFRWLHRLIRPSQSEQAVRRLERWHTLPERYALAAGALYRASLLAEVSPEHAEAWGLYDLMQRDSDAESYPLALLLHRHASSIALDDAALRQLLHREDVQRYLRVHSWQGNRYIHQESFEQLLAGYCGSLWLRRPQPQRLARLQARWLAKMHNAGFVLDSLLV